MGDHFELALRGAVPLVLDSVSFFRRTYWRESTRAGLTNDARPDSAFIREWHRRYPEVAVTLRESVSLDELLGLVDSDEVDVALVPAPAPGRLTITAVAEEEIVLASPISHPLAQQPTVRLEDLDRAPLVHLAPENGRSGWLDRSPARAGVRP